MGTLIAIDNHLSAPSAARLEVFDRGFLYGDSVYESLRTYAGMLFEWEEHLARLHRSAERIELQLPVSDGELSARVRRTLRAASNPESQVRLIATRGAGPLSLDPGLATRGRTVVIVRPLQALPERFYAEGVAVAMVSLSAGERGMDPAAKTGSHLGQVLALGRAAAQGAHEALMVDGQGNVTEGVSSNLFAVIAETVVTPPLGTVLEGVTRRRTLSLARQAGLAVEERTLAATDLRRAGELFITSTTREILPVTRVDGRPVGDGRVGPIAKRLLADFRGEVATWAAARRIG